MMGRVIEALRCEDGEDGEEKKISEGDMWHNVELCICMYFQLPTHWGVNSFML